jgi:hypothetical protein
MGILQIANTSSWLCWLYVAVGAALAVAGAAVVAVAR